MRIIECSNVSSTATWPRHSIPKLFKSPYSLPQHSQLIFYTLAICIRYIIMAPVIATPKHHLLHLARRAALTAGPHLAQYSARHALAPRGLRVNKAQEVTLGIIAVYVVVIALLWNLPYIRMILWPFKVPIPLLRNPSCSTRQQDNN